MSPQKQPKQIRISRRPYRASTLPPHVDQLTRLPWSPERSQAVDAWLWYSQQEGLESLEVAK